MANGLVAGDQLLSPQGPLDGLDGLRRQAGKIGQGSFAYSFALSIGLA